MLIEFLLRMWTADLEPYYPAAIVMATCKPCICVRHASVSNDKLPRDGLARLQDAGSSTESPGAGVAQSPFTPGTTAGAGGPDSKAAGPPSQQVAFGSSKSEDQARGAEIVAS